MLNGDESYKSYNSFATRDNSKCSPVGRNNSNIRKRKHIRSSEKNLKTICMAPNHLSGWKESMQAYTYLRWNTEPEHCLKKVSKDGVFCGSYLPVFSPNTRKYGPEKTPYLDIFHAVGSFQLTSLGYR